MEQSSRLRSRSEQDPRHAGQPRGGFHYFAGSFWALCLPANRGLFALALLPVLRTVAQGFRSKLAVMAAYSLHST